MDFDDIQHRFKFHPADEDTGYLHDLVRGASGALANVLNELLPEGREKSTAITKLEEVMFWANAAIARAQR